MSQPGSPAITSDALQSFIDVRTQVLHALETCKQEVDAKLAYPDNASWVHYLVVVLGGYILAFALVTPLLSAALARQTWLPEIPFASLAIAVVIIILLLTITTILPFLLPKGWRIWSLFSFTLLIYPLFFAFTANIPALLVGLFNVQEFWKLYIVMIAISFGAFAAVWAVLITFRGGLPRIVFLLWTSTRAGSMKKLFPTYEELVQYINAKIGHELDKTSIVAFEQIEAIAQHKLTGLNGRLQSLSLAIGSLALLGLLTLVLTGDQIVGGLNLLAEWLANLIRMPGNEALPVITATQVVAVVLLLFVVGVLRYVMSAYLELRLLEIISILCRIRLIERAATMSTLAPLPTNLPSVATQPRPSERPITVILLGLLTLLTALIYRALSRLVRTK